MAPARFSGGGFASAIAPRRSLFLFVLVAGLAPAGAAMAEALTEPEAIARALQRPAVQALEQSRLQAAQASVSEARRWPNPVVSVEQAEVDEAAGTSTERTWQISQAVDLSGRRGLGRQAAEQHVETARAGLAAQRQQWLGEVRTAFAELLFRQRRAEALQQWQQRIGQASSTVQKLARAGEVSGYDRRRLQQELHTATSQRDQAAADLLLAQHRLAGLTESENAVILAATGELLPAETPAMQGLQARLAQRPDLQALAAQSRAVALEGRAAGRQWLPEITVGVGQRSIEAPTGGGEGLAISVSVPVPVFNHGGARQSRLEAEAAALDADYTLRLGEAQAQLQGQWQQLEKLRQAALHFRQQALQNAQDLSRIADLAYRAGEIGVLELLDAYRTELATVQESLDLERRARQARIDLDALVGTAP
jgi:cobalt-zinc-cadmium efflux system outer membrane protein